MAKQPELYDIEGTRICIGDEIYVSISSNYGSPSIIKGTVERLTPKTVYYDVGEEHMYCRHRHTLRSNETIIVFKGEFKKE